MTSIQNSELILNGDGSVYHLNLLPEDISDTIIFVGDPDRVLKVSKHFDHIEVKKGKREFITHTGTKNGKRLTVISTGIGTDNIDIVLNELDALVNIDLKKRTIKEQKTSLRIVRIGTSGCLREDIPINSVLLSTFGLGLDGLLHYYNRKLSAEENVIMTELEEHSSYQKFPIKPYIAQASSDLLNLFSQDGIYKGITTTCTGFYAPQGRELRLKPTFSTILDELANMKLGNHQLTNFEMETAGIYGMANALGHQALSINSLIANRARGEFSENPKKEMEILIEWALNQLIK